MTFCQFPFHPWEVVPICTVPSISSGYNLQVVVVVVGRGRGSGGGWGFEGGSGG